VLIFPHSTGRHQKACHLHPDNKKDCLICGGAIKYFRDTKGTCSHACANRLFRVGDKHANWKPESYRSTCFLHHNKKCVVCGEQNIVEVHHLDEDRSNNDPSNLIPLCPTHHQYWHSRHRLLINDIVLAYINEWVNKRNDLGSV
jgi:hypothetical protein